MALLNAVEGPGLHFLNSNCRLSGIGGLQHQSACESNIPSRCRYVCRVPDSWSHGRRPS